VENAIRFDDREKVHERQVGAVLISIGSDLYECRHIPSLGYGNVRDVYTSLDLERLLASNGPTGGVLRTASGASPDSVAIVHCVGSLDERHKDYCSAVCCQYSLKFNHLIHKQVPNARVYHLYREMVCPGKSESGLFRHVVHDDKSALMRYGRIDDIVITESPRGLGIQYLEPDGTPGKVTVDMVATIRDSSRSCMDDQMLRRAR
jgi:heterodisulfide reductase subunit A